MSTGTLFRSITLTTLYCANCGVLFGIPDDTEKRRREDHKSFHCPSGHSNYFPQKTDLEETREQLVRTRARLDQAQADASYQRERAERGDRQIRARKAIATRLRNRIKKGKCPCCSHEFKDLKAHMKTQHPKWNPEQAVAALASK